uniref:Uncharacterized protein n=1 Tax=Candidatus Kentrum sp. FW TaxID=2126338 RepID=A0A450SRV3_9GAMM|nr:MAG: hypothetical protein BECKFW1821A_GA0114235_10262 [Candidatus Kentron sp. FW]VFJ56645.1 MAG: hypothetical protein BECKFW1821B_GA0114236_10291 [Candidatus Kentron sp. FW]
MGPKKIDTPPLVRNGHVEYLITPEDERFLARRKAPLIGYIRDRDHDKILARIDGTPRDEGIKIF